MRGFTTVRDLGGPSFPLKQAIDEGLAPGPRILSVGRDDHDHRRPWRPAASVRSAEEPGRTAELYGADGRIQHRRQRGRSAAARARAASFRRITDQARRRRGRILAAHHPRHADLQRAGVARGRRGRRRPEYLCRRARLPAGSDRAGARRRGPVHRTRPSNGRADSEAHGRQGRLAQHPALPQRRGHGRARRPKPKSMRTRCSRARGRSTRWRRSTRSRPRSARTSSFRASWPQARDGC